MRTRQPKVSRPRCVTLLFNYVCGIVAGPGVPGPSGLSFFHNLERKHAMTYRILFFTAALSGLAQTLQHGTNHATIIADSLKLADFACDALVLSPNDTPAFCLTGSIETF